MFTKRFHLLNAFGFPIEVDLSWFVVAVLLSWSLATGYFPAVHPGLSIASYWTMGVVGTLGLFASVLLHELGHAVVARRYDLPIRRIVLFIFGGVAQMEQEPPHARAEFFVAIGGPIVSVALGAAFWVLRAASTAAGLGPETVGTTAYLALVNFVVVGFNLIPAFPLDGGRVLRSILWGWKDDLRWSTRITSGIGSAFGIVLIGLGVLAFIGGNFLAGVWWAILGLFLRGAAGMSYQQLLLRRALEGEPLSRFVTRDPISVEPGTKLDAFVHDVVYEHQHKLYPVLDGGRLVGCVTLDAVKGVPRDRWAERSVGDVAARCSPRNTIASGTDAMHALAKMNRNRASRMLVVDGDRLVGVISLKDLMRFLAIKVELDDAA